MVYGCGEDFLLPPNSGRDVRPGEDGPLPDAKSVLHTGAVDQYTRQIKVAVGDCAGRDVFRKFL